MSKNTSHRRGAPKRALQPTLMSEGEDQPESSGHRQQRLEKILLEEARALLRDEARDPALEGVELLSIELSPDGRNARFAYVATAPIDEERRVGRATGEALARSTGFLRARLAALLDLKRLPKLVFTFVGVRAPEPGAGEGGESW